jgi:hypothetical protein
MTVFTSENPLGKNALTKKNDVPILNRTSSVDAKPKKMIKKGNLAKRKKDPSHQGSFDDTHEPGPLVTAGSTGKKKNNTSTLRKIMSRSSLLKKTPSLSNFMSRRSTQRSSAVCSKTGDLPPDKTVILEQDVGPLVKTQNGKVVQVVQIL